MSKTEIREKVIQYVSESADDVFLRMIYAMMHEYELDQTPNQMTKEELDKRVDEAEEDIQAGRVYSTDEMRSYFDKKQA